MRAAARASMRLSGGTAPLLAVAVDDAAAREVVRRQLDADAVARRDADEVAAHAARRICDELVAALNLDFEHRVRQSLRADRVHHDRGFLLVAVLALCLARPLRSPRPSALSFVLAQT